MVLVCINTHSTDLKEQSVCESLLFLHEKARNQLRYKFIIFEQLSC